MTNLKIPQVKNKMFDLYCYQKKHSYCIVKIPVNVI